MRLPSVKKILVVLSLLLTTEAGRASVDEYEEIVFYHADALGSPVVATDINGDVIWREEYTPYGSRLRHESRETECSVSSCTPVDSLWDEKQWFTGKLEETRTGIQYFGARWYEPELGRFLSVDPVTFKEGNVFSFNRYAYANNNPYKYVDPDGRDSVSLTGTVHLPGSILHFFGLGEVPISGVHGGVVASFPGPWSPEAEFDFGLVGGIDIPSVDFGLGKASIDVGYSKGTLSDLSGDSLEAAATIGTFDAGLNWNAYSGELTGVKFGRGFSLGSSSRALKRALLSVKNRNLKSAFEHLTNNNFSLTYQKNSAIGMYGSRESNRIQNTEKIDHD